MGWFKRKTQGVFTESKDKKDVPQGLWHKCPKCKQLTTKEEHKNNFHHQDQQQYLWDN